MYIVQSYVRNSTDGICTLILGMTTTAVISMINLSALFFINPSIIQSNHSQSVTALHNNRGYLLCSQEFRSEFLKILMGSDFSLHPIFKYTSGWLCNLRSYHYFTLLEETCWKTYISGLKYQSCNIERHFFKKYQLLHV